MRMRLGRELFQPRARELELRERRERSHAAAVPEPGIVVDEGEPVPRLAFDVVRRREGVLALGRRMAARAVETEAGVEDGERRLVAVERSGEDLAPIPAVRGAFAVADHEGPVVAGVEEIVELLPGPAGVLRGGRLELLLDDHRGAVQVALPAAFDPLPRSEERRVG